MGDLWVKLRPHHPECGAVHGGYRGVHGAGRVNKHRRQLNDRIAVAHPHRKTIGQPAKDTALLGNDYIGAAVLSLARRWRNFPA